MKPSEIVDGKQIEFTTIDKSNYYYPKATKRCKVCGYLLAPYTELWGKEPHVCALCEEDLRKQYHANSNVYSD